MAPSSATYQRIFMTISRMKNPTIIMARSDEGEGSPRLITDPIQLKRRLEG